MAGAAEGTSWSHCVKVNWLQCRGCGCARRVWGAVAGEWLRQGGLEGGREALALLYNFVVDAVITGRAPPAWPVDGRQPHTQPPSVPGTLSHDCIHSPCLGRAGICSAPQVFAHGVPIHCPARTALSLHPVKPQAAVPRSNAQSQRGCSCPGGLSCPQALLWDFGGSCGCRAVKPNPAREQSRLLVSRTGRLIGTRELFA